VGQVAVAYDRDRGAAIERAHDQFRSPACAALTVSAPPPSLTSARLRPA
jgi:hypothetical protein